MAARDILLDNLLGIVAICAALLVGALFWHPVKQWLLYSRRRRR